MALRALAVLLVLVALLVPAESPGCGPFFPNFQFTAEVVPEAPGQMAAGDLGILQPSFERLYQVIAYRYLTGVGLNVAERQALHLPRADRSPLPNSKTEAVKSPVELWLAARNAVPGTQPVKDLDVYRQVKKDGFFDSYLNCNDDAFRTAVTTLERVRRAGAAADWIKAQDIVFKNCSDGNALPPRSSDPKLAADRAYQIASAKFYSEQYDAARQDFQSIAGDAASPWRSAAPYLSARCLIRAGKLADAERELQRIADDPAQRARRASALALLGYVRVHLAPKVRMHELAVALLKPNSQTTIEQDLTDYRMLFDQQVKPETSDEMTDWIVSFQAKGLGALDKWRAQHSLPWLVAALYAAKTGDASLNELLPAAAAIQPDSPAYLTVNYHRVRLLPQDEARTLAAQLLTGTLRIAERNMLRAESMRLARNFDEFLKFAPRAEVRDATEFFDDPDGDRTAKPPAGTLTKLDEDSAQILDRAVPLALLRQASASAQLPVPLRQTLQRVVAIRTLVLTPSPDFAQVFQLLKAPGDAPFVRSDVSPRQDAATELSDYRDNWWCSGGTAEYRSEDKKPSTPLAEFLTPADRATGEAEWKKLAAVPTGPNWLGEQTLAFAQKNPADPRVPEALYRVVRATRLGCTDKDTGTFSKRAFDLLHSKYPKSEWTQKTPYWFKSNE